MSNLPFGCNREVKNHIGMKIREHVYAHPEFYRVEYNLLSKEVQERSKKAKKRFVEAHVPKRLVQKLPDKNDPKY